LWKASSRSLWKRNPGAVIEDILKTNFPEKVEACFDADLFGPAFADFLLILNDHRNHFAHKLGHHMSFYDAFMLVGQAAARGIDFSDETIHEDKDSSRENYPFSRSWQREEARQDNIKAEYRELLTALADAYTTFIRLGP
jgi:hypothetical protein